MKKAIFFLGLLAILPSLGSTEVGQVSVIRADGVVNPVMAEFIEKNLEKAAAEGADALVIELDTPGGLDTSMRLIVKSILNSPVPVIVFVSPGGARAASAGVFITLSAHIAAMAPGTNIGAAHPVAISGGSMDETMESKVANDAAAYIRSLAEKRGRNADWAEKAVRESVSVTESVAVEERIIDFVAPDLAGLLEQAEGREVSTISGTRILKTKGAKIERHEMSARLKLLDVISNPNIAYLLMLAGIIGLYIELTNPGVIFPGVAGAICLILAFYALQTLPVNYAGVLLIVLALVLFIMEIKVTSYGLLTVGGIIALLAGSLLLFDSPLPFLRVSLSVILPTVVVMSGFIVIVSYLVIRAQKSPVTTGQEGMLGIEGTAITDLGPDHAGQVSVHGEIWQARSTERITAGSRIITEAIHGLTLYVKSSPQPPE